MPEVNVQKIPTTDDRSLPIFDEFERLAERIRLEAYNLFVHRGSNGAGALDDWLEAERHLCWPAAKLAEHDGAFTLEVALAGFEPGEISLTATPREVMIKACHKGTKKSDGKEPRNLRWSEFRSDEVFRRIELPSTIDVGKTTASLKNGLLTVSAPIAASTETRHTKIAVARNG
jgi:HSP20 family molecular chaperone IbpA